MFESDFRKEEVILSQAMVDHEKAVELCFVNDEHFKDGKNKLIYKAIRELVERDGKEADQITVCQKLEEWGKLKEAGGAFNVARIAAAWIPETTKELMSETEFHLTVSDREEWFRQIRGAVDIVDLISETVTLFGPSENGNYIGKCMLCGAEKLNVSQSRQIYKCFACSGGGNALWWLCETRLMSFHDALRYLAGKAEIELPEGLR